MPRPWRITYSGAKYHITSRGNGRQAIFLDDNDYKRFLKQLQLALEVDEVILYSYALMPNHYHLFIETPLGNLKKFMQRLNTAYSMYYRYKHTKPGHCFQGRYGAKLVDGDEYIIRLTRYIHLNSIKVKSKEHLSFTEKVKELNAYCRSSYPGYIDADREEEFVDYKWVKLMGLKTLRGNRNAYHRYIESMISADDSVCKLSMTASRYAIGCDGFIEKVESDVAEMQMEKGCTGKDVFLPDMREVAIYDIESAISKAFKVSVDDLHSYGATKTGNAKGLAIELCCQLSGKTQREIAEHFGYKTGASVVHHRKTVQLLFKEDAKLKKKYENLKNKLLNNECSKFKL